MSDLKERLKDAACMAAGGVSTASPQDQIEWEAVDCIEALERENARLRELLKEAHPFIGWTGAPDRLADRVWKTLESDDA